MNSNVLNQDVDMHAPPIVFKNQDNNDIPITSGTYLHAPDAFLPAQLKPANHNLLYSEPHSPFKVDIQSVNIGISHEDTSDANVSIEETDDSSAQSAASPFDDPIIDQHTDDDFENEQGEVIQESNAVPQLVSSDQSLIDQVHLNRIPDYTKPTTKSVAKHHNTQTETNNLWHKYPSTTEYSHSPTSERTTPFATIPITTTTATTAITTTSTTKHQHQQQYAPIQSNRIPLHSADHVKLNMPHVAPSLVNDMYATPVNGQNRTQPILKPIGFNVSSSAVRNPNKQSYYGYQSPDARPPKLHTSIAHAGSIFSPPNPPVPSQHSPAHYGEKYAPRPHQSRRPVSLGQKPFSRFPVHYSNPIHPNANLTGPHIADQSVKPNWMSGKPFDSAAHRPNVFYTTTVAPDQAHPTIETQHKQQQPQPLQPNQQHHHQHHYGHHSLSTQKPFTKYTLAGGAKVPAFTANTTKAPQTLTKLSTKSPYDLSRGKPFVFVKPSTSSSVLNIGEEKRPITHSKPRPVMANGTKLVDAHDPHDGTEIFDFKESINPHNFASVTEKTVTTEHPVASVTSAEHAAPFGHNYKNRIPVSIPVSMVPEVAYPKTPATDMLPPPTYTPKYQNSYLHAKPSPTSTYQNVRVEEVMGMNPPPIPRLPIKIHKQPEIQGNYGKISLHHVHPVSIFVLLSIIVDTG